MPLQVSARGICIGLSGESKFVSLNLLVIVESICSTANCNCSSWLSISISISPIHLAHAQYLNISALDY